LAYGLAGLSEQKSEVRKIHLQGNTVRDVSSDD
jgi:hypothetical protein